MAKPSDLTDETALRAFRPIKRTGDETTQRIALLVSAMSNAVRRYTQRQFLGKDLGDEFDPDAAETRSFSYDGAGYLSLAPFEARDILEVKVDGTACAPTGYVPEPRQRTPEGTFLYLTLPERRCARGAQLVEVTATWGIVDLPDDVELACLHAVADAYGNPEGAAQRSLGDGLVLTEGNDDSGGSLPRASRALLAPLRRP